MLAQANIFVGTYSSNVERMVALLRESRDMPRSSTLSLDRNGWFATRHFLSTGKNVTCYMLHALVLREWGAFSGAPRALPGFDGKERTSPSKANKASYLSTVLPQNTWRALREMVGPS